MEWNKIELRRKEKNLPEVGVRVLFATNEGAPSETTFYKFIGSVTIDMKNIDTGYGWKKLTSNYWWSDISEDPKIE